MVAASSALFLAGDEAAAEAVVAPAGFGDGFDRLLEGGFGDYAALLLATDNDFLSCSFYANPAVRLSFTRSYTSLGLLSLAYAV